MMHPLTYNLALLAALFTTAGVLVYDDHIFFATARGGQATSAILLGLAVLFALITVIRAISERKTEE